MRLGERTAETRQSLPVPLSSEDRCVEPRPGHPSARAAVSCRINAVESGGHDSPADASYSDCCRFVNCETMACAKWLRSAHSTMGQVNFLNSAFASRRSSKDRQIRRDQLSALRLAGSLDWGGWFVGWSPNGRPVRRHQYQANFVLENSSARSGRFYGVAALRLKSGGSLLLDRSTSGVRGERISYRWSPAMLPAARVSTAGTPRMLPWIQDGSN